MSTRRRARAVDVWWLWVDEEGRGGPGDWDLLDASERERASRFHFERHRREFVAARAELRRLVGEWTDIAPGDVPLAYGEAGKPAVAADAELHFNVSHSEGLAAYAVTRVCPIGIDVERVRTVPDFDDIAARYFTREERRRIRQRPTDEHAEAFLEVWVAREAVVKATGQGIGALEGEHTRDRGPGWTVSSLELPPGYVGALALANPAPFTLRGPRRAGAPLAR